MILLVFCTYSGAMRHRQNGFQVKSVDQQTQLYFPVPLSKLLQVTFRCDPRGPPNQCPDLLRFEQHACGGHMTTHWRKITADRAAGNCDLDQKCTRDSVK